MLGRNGGGGEISQKNPVRIAVGPGADDGRPLWDEFGKPFALLRRVVCDESRHSRHATEPTETRTVAPFRKRPRRRAAQAIPSESRTRPHPGASWTRPQRPQWRAGPGSWLHGRSGVPAAALGCVDEHARASPLPATSRGWETAAVGQLPPPPSLAGGGLAAGASGSGTPPEGEEASRAARLQPQQVSAQQSPPHRSRKGARRCCGPRPGTGRLSRSRKAAAAAAAGQLVGGVKATRDRRDVLHVEVKLLDLIEPAS